MLQVVFCQKHSVFHKLSQKIYPDDQHDATIVFIQVYKEEVLVKPNFFFIHLWAMPTRIDPSLDPKGPTRPRLVWKSDVYEKNLLKMVFCYQNCSDLLWEKIVLVIEKNFEITWTIYSNSERSEQFLVTEWFFNLFLEVSQI